MNMHDLREAREFAVMNGCKALVYGPPGSGKTPLLNTAPRPVLLICEPGTLSLRSSRIPAYEAFTPKRIDEFFDWITTSNERRNFDTLEIDSVSEMAQIYLDEAKTKYGDGRKQHGFMYDKAMKHLTNVYFMKQMHVVAICKQGVREIEGIGAKLIPQFPGQALNRDVPHRYDFILHYDLKTVPNVGTVKAIQTQEDFAVAARNRTGNLDFYEQPNLAALFAKAMS